MSNCPFCSIDKEDIVFEEDYVLAIYDKYPVSTGHMLILPKFHDEKYFATCLRSILWAMVDRCKLYLDAKYSPDGYNVGINIGEAAGQTVEHMHIHLIPRYEGDVDNPAGGVRGVIPERQKYGGGSN
ncbi:MAG: HIT family protein [bacterium]